MPSIRRVKLTILALAAIFAAVSSLCCCGRQGKAEKDVIDMEWMCGKYSHAGQFAKSDSIARLLYGEAQRTGDSLLMAHSLYYLGVYDMNPHTAKNRHDRLRHCESMLQSYRNDTLLLKVYNAMGIYEAKYYRHYAKSAYYVTKSLELARKLKLEDMAMVAEQNLSAVMVFLDDTLGLKYDLDIFNYAKEHNDTSLLLASAVHCGLYYSRRHFDAAKASYYASFLKATSKASRYAEILGNVAARQKNYQRAEAFYRQAVSSADEEKNYTAWLYYSTMLYECGRYSESLAAAKEAEKLYKSLGYGGGNPSISSLYADNLHKLSRESEAFAWLKEHIRQQDSVRLSLHRETIDRYRIQYDTGKKEQELLMEKMRVSHMWVVMLIVVVSSVFIVSVLVVYYNYRKRMLLSIVRQNKNMITLEDMKNVSATASLSAASPAVAQPSDNVKATLSDETADSIYQKIYHELVDNGEFMNPQLSRESLCSKCGCNHTYLTLAIKKKLGMSYTQYVSSLRIHESLKLLSDNDCQLTIKEIAQRVGFSSDKTFFAAFKKQIGMSPAVYRNIAKNN